MVVASTGSGVTVQDLVDDTRRQLSGGLNDQVNFLTNDLTETQTNIVLDDPVDGLSRGTVIEVGNEEMYVRSVVVATKTLTVIRGWNRSEKTAHGAGETVRIAPLYTTSDIFNAVVAEIASLNGTGLRDYTTVEVIYSPSSPVVELDVDKSRPVLFVQASRTETGAASDRHRPVSVVLIRDSDTADFTSGYAIHIIRGGRRGEPIRVTVARAFGVPTSLGTDVEGSSVGLPSYVYPIVPVGAAWRLLLSKEARRLSPEASHGSRRAEEVQPGAIAFLGRALQGQREDLIRQAIDAQFVKYPPQQQSY